jgi:hypothetical protein
MLLYIKVRSLPRDDALVNLTSFVRERGHHWAKGSRKEDQSRTVQGWS